MQLCGSLLVLCPVHFVGLLEDQIRWQIWDCDSSGHTSLTTVGILCKVSLRENLCRRSTTRSLFIFATALTVRFL